MINQIIKDWVGEDIKDYRKRYKEWGEEMRMLKQIEERAYNQALQDLTSRIPQLTERIIGIMQKIVDDIYEEPEKTDDDVFEARVIEDLIDILKESKE